MNYFSSAISYTRVEENVNYTYSKKHSQSILSFVLVTHISKLWRKHHLPLIFPLFVVGSIPGSAQDLFLALYSHSIQGSLQIDLRYYMWCQRMNQLQRPYSWYYFFDPIIFHFQIKEIILEAVTCDHIKEVESFNSVFSQLEAHVFRIITCSDHEPNLHL